MDDWTGWCGPSSVYNHDRPKFGKMGWHSYYDSRNHVYILKNTFLLLMFDHAIYQETYFRHEHLRKE